MLPLPGWVCHPRRREPSTTTLVGLTTLAHESHLAQTALHSLTEYDVFERQHEAIQHVRWAAFSLGAGFAFAVFPFSPGFVDYCKPSANPGWLCGARAAAFLSACEATMVGMAMGRELYRGRNRELSEATRLSARIERMCTRDMQWPSELISVYRKGSPKTREDIQSLLRHPFPVESA